MFITYTKKWRKCEDRDDDNLFIGYNYYRLSEAYRDRNGRPRNRVVMGLGELSGFSKEERNGLADLLTAMIECGEMALCSNSKVQDAALRYYNEYLENRRKALLAAEAEEKLREAARLEAERRLRETVPVKLSSLRQTTARHVGAENVCLDTIRKLGIRPFLLSHGFNGKQADTAVMQIIARAIYPGSELRTVRCLQENSALCELLGIHPEDITKDTLYRSARKLWDIHREMEDHLHARVVDMFNIEEKIYLFDLTNTYFEGRMEESELCAYGRSKEKRDDCKIVVLAAVVNTEGLLVRTEIFEGNRQDVTTLQEVIGSLDDGLSRTRRIVVMDAGFSSEANLEWLRTNGYDYITVMRSRGVDYTCESDIIEKVHDNRKQEIRLQPVKVDGVSDTVLLVDSDAKALKERGMYSVMLSRYEQGLERIRKGIEGKGTKQRDPLQRRLGRLQEKYPRAAKAYDVQFTYDNGGKAVSMSYCRNGEAVEGMSAMHGKYLLRTTLDSRDETSIWTFYNVIRTVEETFKTLKTDLDIRPVFHKTDEGTKAHLNLAVLAYWIVSTTRYRLRESGITVRWSELLRILSTQVRVTAVFETDNNHRIAIRRSTEPESKVEAIYTALDISSCSVVRLKSVVHPKEPPEKSGG